MVRINCGIEPTHLSDQHLIAEYREILLAFGYYKKNNNRRIKKSKENLKHPLRFYQDKLTYLAKRFIKLKSEMIRRGMAPMKNLSQNGFDSSRFNDFTPNEYHQEQIKERITQRINEKEESVGSWYKYCGTNQPIEFFEGLMNGQL